MMVKAQICNYVHMCIYERGLLKTDVAIETVLMSADHY